MPHQRRPSFLRLIHSVDTEVRRTSNRTNSGTAQDTFLPSELPNTLIFFSWSNVAEDDLLDIFELSKPKIIFDLRITPRFDLGRLTRKRFFELIRQYECRYIDLFGRIGISNINDALANPILVAEHVASFMESLVIPNAGPVVFLHESGTVDDEYVSVFASALPSKSGMAWQVFRPLGIRDDEISGSSLADNHGTKSATTTPLARKTVFISHATPEDNAFVLWLTSKLSAAGYEVWSDLTNLKGGDVFWENIENTIRSEAAKVLFVQSADVTKKVGTRKEIYLALKVSDRNSLRRFVIPLRIDDTPFDQTLIELIDIQAIDCRNDWLVGLRNLLALLERDNVPRTASYKAHQFSELVSKVNQPSYALLHSPESLTSNWLRLIEPPEKINFFSCSGLRSSQLTSIAAELPVPAFAYYSHIATTATRDNFSDALDQIGHGNVNIGERASISWTDFIAARYGNLPSWTKRESQYYVTRLLNRAWFLYMKNHNACRAPLSNLNEFWYFADQHFEKNTVHFVDFSGRSVRRKLIGYSAKRRVFWHFGIQARSIFNDGEIYMGLIPHVTFSTDGKVPLESNTLLHSYRRSFCRNWWNDRWRDLLKAFVVALARSDDVLRLNVGSASPLKFSSQFCEFTCPVTVTNVETYESQDIFLEEDEFDDVEDEEYYSFREFDDREQINDLDPELNMKE